MTGLKILSHMLLDDHFIYIECLLSLNWDFVSCMEVAMLFNDDVNHYMGLIMLLLIMRIC